PDTAGAPGTIHVTDASGTTVHGCLGLDEDATSALFAPLEALTSGASYSVTVTTGVLDLGSTPLASEVVQSVTAP
ncbi:MAG: Ig-like domain-containing protein, partial [Deltaproteobacteria bacterium]|nr:Ig-like domain-containing protein [Deltaproteobacteria bacterium]